VSKIGHCYFLNSCSKRCCVPKIVVCFLRHGIDTLECLCLNGLTVALGAWAPPLRDWCPCLECPIQLKVRFMDGTLEVRMLWLSDTLCVTEWAWWPLLSATKLRPMNCTFRAYEVCTNFRRGLRRRWLLFTLCIMFSQISFRRVAVCNMYYYERS